ncbi:hypothetical protein AB0K12_37085 [Nonomuraea sp. NPDC049419]
MLAANQDALATLLRAAAERGELPSLSPTCAGSATPPAPPAATTPPP